MRIELGVENKLSQENVTRTYIFQSEIILQYHVECKPREIKQFKCLTEKNQKSKSGLFYDKNSRIIHPNIAEKPPNE